MSLCIRYIVELYAGSMVLLRARDREQVEPHDPAAVYSWEYSLDQETWTPLPDTRKAQTELSGLTSACRYSFRFRASTRAGQQDYSQIVSLLAQ